MVNVLNVCFLLRPPPKSMLELSKSTPYPLPLLASHNFPKR